MAGASSVLSSPSNRDRVRQQGMKTRRRLGLEPRKRPPHIRRKGDLILRIACLLPCAVLEPGVPKTVPLRILGLGAGLLPAGCSECCPPEAVLGSRATADLDGEVATRSCIWQSARKVGVAGCA